MIKPNEEGKSKEVQGLEKTIASIRTQMKIQQRQAQELAEAVLGAFGEPTAMGAFCISLQDEAAAKRACEIALAVLA